MGRTRRETQHLLRLVAKRGGGKHRAVRDYGDRVEKICRVHDVPAPVREYQFDTDGWTPPRYDKNGNLKLRKWRFDCAWPDAKVAVECHGGIGGGANRGRHVRRGGINADAEKMTAAQLQGWTVLVFTADQIPSSLFGEKVDQLVAVLRRALGVNDGQDQAEDQIGRGRGSAPHP